MLSEATWIHRAAAVFQGAGCPLYIVGGAVRNPLMGLPISDVDVCGPARPETVLAMCARARRYGPICGPPISALSNCT